VVFCLQAVSARAVLTGVFEKVFGGWSGDPDFFCSARSVPVDRFPPPEMSLGPRVDQLLESQQPKMAIVDRLQTA
jgi:hypothetical protein